MSVKSKLPVSSSLTSDLISGDLDFLLQPIPNAEAKIGPYKPARQTLAIGAYMKELSDVNADSLKKSLIFTFQPEVGEGNGVGEVVAETHPITVLGEFMDLRLSTVYSMIVEKKV